MSEREPAVDGGDQPVRPPAGPVVPTARALKAVALTAGPALGALVTMAWAWPRVPAQIPWQWDADGTPSAIGPAWIWWAFPVLAGVIGVGLLLVAAHVPDRLLRVPTAALGAALGVFGPWMSARVVLTAADPGSTTLSSSAAVWLALGVACLAGAVAAVLFAREVRSRPASAND